MRKIIQKVTIVGLGYVGLPLAVRFAEEGVAVTGIDIDPDKVRMLNAGESYIRHLKQSSIDVLRSNLFHATRDFRTICATDAVILCVPTPLDEHLQPDLSYVIDTMQSVIPHLRNGQTLCLESTTYPGTTEEEICPLIEASGLRIGEDICVVYSPEREDPGRIDFNTKTTPKIVAGVTEQCLNAGMEIYRRIIDKPVPVSSPRVAEMAKLLENIHRAVNIGLVNEMKIVADAMNLDIHEVIDAAATKPFGFVPYRPGPGLGGHCIPIDPFYLTWKAREYGINTRFIELAGEVNHYMPEWTVNKISQALNQHGKPIKGSKILILGIAYKKNVDDMRETPAAEIMRLLEGSGALLNYSDPHVSEFKTMRRYSFDLKSKELNADFIASQDCVVLITDHDDFDYLMIQSASKLLVDTRGRFRDRSAHIIRA